MSEWGQGTSLPNGRQQCRRLIVHILQPCLSLWCYSQRKLQLVLYHAWPCVVLYTHMHWSLTLRIHGNSNKLHLCLFSRRSWANRHLETLPSADSTERLGCTLKWSVCSGKQALKSDKVSQTSEADYCWLSCEDYGFLELLSQQSDCSQSSPFPCSYKERTCSRSCCLSVHLRRSAFLRKSLLRSASPDQAFQKWCRRNYSSNNALCLI